MIRVMNVLFDERLGGPQLRVEAVAMRLRQRHIETVVVMPQGDSTYSRRLAEHGIPHRVIPLRRVRKSRHPRDHLAWLLDFIPSIIRLRRLIRELDIDAVHTNGALNTQAAIASRLARRPVVWHLNDVDTPARIARLMAPVMGRISSAVVLASEAVGRHYWPGGPPPATTIIYAPVDTELYGQAGTGAADESMAVVGTVGNLNPSKGQDVLIQAFARPARAHPRARLKIIGAPLATRQAYHQRLWRLTEELGIGEQVDFLGHQTDIPATMASLTVYVQASRADACPMTLLEAMASGRPSIGTRVGGIPEIIEDRVSGLLVPSEDPDALAEALAMLLDDADLRSRLGQAARDRMRARFDMTICVDRHESVYRAVTKSSRSESHVTVGHR